MDTWFELRLNKKTFDNNWNYEILVGYVKIDGGRTYRVWY